MNQPAQKSAAPETPQADDCRLCRVKKWRLAHQFALYNRAGGDALKAHLEAVAGPGHDAARLERRMKLVATAYRIFEQEFKDGGAPLTIGEAIDRAAARLGLRRKTATAGIDRAQPGEAG